MLPIFKFASKNIKPHFFTLRKTRHNAKKLKNFKLGKIGTDRQKEVNRKVHPLPSRDKNGQHFEHEAKT